MDDQRIGWSLRSIRIRKRWRQEDLAARAHVSRWVVMRIEQGRLGSVPLGTLRAVAAALDARVDAVVRWQGGDLSRLVSARHARMHEMIARYLSGVPGWIVEPEVSFSIYGERGIIDVLAWHPTSRILLVIELKTEVIDLNEMLGTLDRKRRLAWAIAKDRDLDPVVVGTWVVVAGQPNQPTNGRRASGGPAGEAADRWSRGRPVATTSGRAHRCAQLPAKCARPAPWRQSRTDSPRLEANGGSETARYERGLSAGRARHPAPMQFGLPDEVLNRRQSAAGALMAGNGLAPDSDLGQA